MSQSVGGLARAVADRVARALRARDRLHGFLFREASSASIDEALFYFDAFLVALGGAFDAAARVAHATYSISQKVRPSWRTNGWLDKLGSTAPALHQAVMTGTTVRATIDAIFTLRNLLHEEPLRVVGILGTGYQVAEYRAAVPESERGVLVAAVQQLGDIRTWGLDDVQAEFLSLDLGKYAEAVLPAAITGLNELMRLTEVERLGVDAAPPFEPNEALVNISPRLRLLAGI